MGREGAGREQRGQGWGSVGWAHSPGQCGAVLIQLLRAVQWCEWGLLLTLLPLSRGPHGPGCISREAGADAVGLVPLVTRPLCVCLLCSVSSPVLFAAQLPVAGVFLQSVLLPEDPRDSVPGYWPGGRGCVFCVALSSGLGLDSSLSHSQV